MSATNFRKHGYTYAYTFVHTDVDLALIIFIYSTGLDPYIWLIWSTLLICHFNCFVLLPEKCYLKNFIIIHALIKK